MRQLRDPENGCPWDIEQTFETIAPYTVEEAYEVADAISRGHWEDLRQELGDLLLQVVYHSQMAREAGHFDFKEVTEAISAKMVARHPHVFGSESVDDADAMRKRWEDLKAAERQAKTEGPTSLLDDVALGFPALMRAQKLQKRAARVGFDWPEIAPVIDKLKEEIEELEAATRPTGKTPEEIDELGDVLFAVANYARHRGIDLEECLRAANRKFERRFRFMEQEASLRGIDLEESELSVLETLWQAAKRAEDR